MIATLRSVVAAVGLVLCANAAHASPGPASVVGSWNAFSDQTASTLAITTQGTVGPCFSIVGTMTDQPSGTADNIDGFYCQESGRISFLRRDASTGRWSRAYAGNTSWDGATVYIGGTVLQEWKSVSERLGEYDFWAQK